MRQSVPSYLLLVPWRQPSCVGFAVEVPTAAVPRKPETATMGQINVNPNTPATPNDVSGAVTAASRDLTWALSVVVIIAALAIAIVYVSHNVAF
jgi:hypothetical protein